MISQSRLFITKLPHTAINADTHKTASASGLLCAPVSTRASWTEVVNWRQFATSRCRVQVVSISLARQVSLDLPCLKAFRHKYHSLMHRLHFFAWSPVASQVGRLLAIIVDSDGGGGGETRKKRIRDLCVCENWHLLFPDRRILFFEQLLQLLSRALQEPNLYACVTYCNLNSNVPPSVRREAFEVFYLNNITSHKRFM
jgi:hypothetical protein